jgi:hypothetical protein
MVLTVGSKSGVCKEVDGLNGTLWIMMESRLDQPSLPLGLFWPVVSLSPPDGGLFWNKYGAWGCARVPGCAPGHT